MLLTYTASLTILLFTAFCLGKGNALKCYKCDDSDSDLNRRCGDLSKAKPMNCYSVENLDSPKNQSITKYKKIIEDGGRNTCNVDFDALSKVGWLPKVACFKVEYQVKGKAIVYRSCGVRRGGLLDYCKVFPEVLEEAGGNLTDCGSCVQDECGEPTGILIEYWALFVTLAAAVIVTCLLCLFCLSV